MFYEFILVFTPSQRGVSKCTRSGSFMCWSFIWWDKSSDEDNCHLLELSVLTSACFPPGRCHEHLWSVLRWDTPLFNCTPNPFCQPAILFPGIEAAYCAYFPPVSRPHFGFAFDIKGALQSKMKAWGTRWQLLTVPRRNGPVSVETNIPVQILAGFVLNRVSGFMLTLVFLGRRPHGVFLGVPHRDHRLVGDRVCPHHHGKSAGPLHLPGLCWGSPGGHRHQQRPPP